MVPPWAAMSRVKAVEEYGSTAFGWAMEDVTSLCKLVADADTGQLLGAHLMGEQASTLIQPLIQAMTFGLGVKVPGYILVPVPRSANQSRWAAADALDRSLTRIALRGERLPRQEPRRVR